MQLIKLSLMPMWVVCPKEAIAPGAKWQVTVSQKLAGQLDVTQTTDYELVTKKGKAWTIKGATKVSGQDQTVGDGKIGKIGGTGITEVTLNEGALVHPTKQSIKTDFTATATPDPAAKDKTVSLQFHLEQANALTPKP